MTTFGADVSHYQTALQTADAVKGGARFVICKATEGTQGVDPSHGLHTATARAGGAQVGYYHFAKSCAHWDLEARHFLAEAQPKPGDAVAVDLENMDGDWAQRVTYACGWIELVHSVTRAQPLWYTNKSWHAQFMAAASMSQAQYLNSFPWWVATGGLAPAEPGVNGWAVHQYSTAGSIDHDVLAPNVTWQSFAIPLEPPAPTPTPTPQPLEDDVFRFLLPGTQHQVLCCGGKLSYLVAGGVPANAGPLNDPPQAQVDIWVQTYGPVTGLPT